MLFVKLICLFDFLLGSEWKETRFRAQEFGLADSNDNGGEYEDAAAYANTGVAADFLSMSNHHPFQYNLQQHGDSLGYRNLHDLRLAWV